MSSNLKLVTELSEPREILANAIEVRDRESEGVDACFDMLIRANAFVEQLEKNLAQFENVDARIQASRAQAFKQTICEGRALGVAPLSPELSAAAAKRLDAQNQLEAARQARDELIATSDGQQAKLTLRQSEVEAAAKNVLVDYATNLVNKLAEAEHSAAIMRSRLYGLTSLRPGGMFHAPEVVKFLRSGPANASVQGGAEDRRYWDNFLAALCENANAEPGE